MHNMFECEFQNDRIREMIIDGYSVSDICEEVDLKKTWVYTLIKRNGWSDLLRPSYKYVVIMIENGEKVKNIAKNSGLTPTSIYRLIKKMGINYVQKKARKKSLDNWPSTIYTDIDKIAIKFMQKHVTLNLDIDDIKDEIIEVMSKIDANDNVELKEAYFRDVIFGRLNDYIKKVINIKSVTDSLTDEEGVEIGIAIEYDLDYALDNIGDIK